MKVIIMSQIEFKKQELRKEYIKIRNNIDNKNEKSKIIISRVIKDVAYKNAKIIGIYKSFAFEVNTSELIEYSINIGKIVALPKVVNNELKFYKINSLADNLIKSEFGVEEPLENEENFITKNNIELIIVPGICFDKEKNRLGFGKGYYDRLLINTKLKTIAICFYEQIMESENLPTTNNDIKIQKIITDQKIYL